MFDVLVYIREHISENIQVSEMADYFGYSKWHFCKKFHEYTGVTVVEYIRHHRIQLAALDILEGKKITDVSFDYGYDTVGGFNKAFLKEYGCLPREYRKRAKDCVLYYERRKATMFKLSDRCMFLRDEAVNLKNNAKYYYAQRNVYFKVGMIMV